MRQSVASKLVALALVFVFPAAMFAADTGAMLVPSGKVSVNGAAVPRSTAAFPGDRIETAANSGVTLTLAGSSVQLAPQSSAVFQPAAIELGPGAATVATTSGMKGQVLNLKLAPTSASAKYRFGLRGNKVIIAVLEGSLKINDGKQDMLLAGGKAISIPVDAADPQATPPVKAGNAGLSNAAAIGIGIAVAGLGIGLAVGLTQAIAPGATSPVH